MNRFGHARSPGASGEAAPPDCGAGSRRRAGRCPFSTSALTCVPRTVRALHAGVPRPGWPPPPVPTSLATPSRPAGTSELTNLMVATVVSKASQLRVVTNHACTRHAPVRPLAAELSTQGLLPASGASHHCCVPPEPGTDRAPDGWLVNVTSAGGGGQVEAHRGLSPGGPAVLQKAGSSSPGSPLLCDPRAVTALTAQAWDRSAGDVGWEGGASTTRRPGRGASASGPSHGGGGSGRAGFCGPVTAWTPGQTLSSSFLFRLHPHLLPAGGGLAPIPVTETGGPGRGPGKAPPPGREMRLHLGK